MNLKRIEYIKKTFKLSDNIVAQINEVCDTLSMNKYAIWLAKEIKKNNGDVTKILNTESLIYIRDWSQQIKTKTDILSLTFEEAFKRAVVFHEKLLNNSKNFKLDSTLQIDENRILYKCMDNVHFFYRLKPDELKTEGNLMGHCVGKGIYSSKIKSRDIEIVSLRDDKNQPHVTIEIDRKRGREIQTMGKGNHRPVEKYLNLITEFTLSIIAEDDKEVLYELMGFVKKNRQTPSSL